MAESLLVRVQWYRRLLVHWDYCPISLLGVVQLAVLPRPTQVISEDPFMSQKTYTSNLLGRIGLLIGLCAGWQAQGQTTTTPYPSMAPLEQYLMQRNAEMALARSAAPDSISRDADVLVLGPHGYESAATGKNGFVCVVQRSWTAGATDPDFWNPKLRGPTCFNAPAARSYLPIVFKKTELAFAGTSKERMFESIKASFDRKELPAMEPGSMCYMMSREQYLNDAVGRWHPHLMFFLPQRTAMSWGAGLPGSPVIVSQDPEDHRRIFMITVAKWSDGAVEHSDETAANDSHKH
jgi:hypothetical protein